MRCSALLLVMLMAPAEVAAQVGSAEWPLVPGRMGFNALPVLPNADPVPPGRGELEVGAATQLSGVIAEDGAATPYFRLTLPFREVAALDVDGVPLELFRTSSATQARLAARERDGIARGDVRFGARFLLRAEGRAPALGVRFVVKSTTGKALHSRRFTNAPGYEIDALAGKDLGAVAGMRLRALARTGLAVWQFAPDRQDDALAYGATLRAVGRSAAVEVEWRGYLGWRFDDRPSLVGLTALAPLGWGELRGTINAGLSSDAPPLEVRLGVLAFFDMPGAARVSPPSRPDAAPRGVAGGRGPTAEAAPEDGAAGEREGERAEGEASAVAEPTARAEEPGRNGVEAALAAQAGSGDRDGPQLGGAAVRP